MSIFLFILPVVHYFETAEMRAYLWISNVAATAIFDFYKPFFSLFGNLKMTDLICVHNFDMIAPTIPEI